MTIAMINVSRIGWIRAGQTKQPFSLKDNSSSWRWQFGVGTFVAGGRSCAILGHWIIGWQTGCWTASAPSRLTRQEQCQVDPCPAALDHPTFFVEESLSERINFITNRALKSFLMFPALSQASYMFHYDFITYPTIRSCNLLVRPQQQESPSAHLQFVHGTGPRLWRWSNTSVK